jgi:hypothetical protein
MKSAMHYVVTTNTEGALNLAGPLARYESTLPKKVVQWGCSGPWVIAWVRSVPTRQELLGDALLATNIERWQGDSRPLRWLRKKFGL